MIMGKLLSGGVEQVIYTYYRAIDKNKVQFDFFYDADSTVEPPRDLVEMGARFYKIPPYQQLFSYIKCLRCHFRDNQYVIVHSNINTLSVFPLFAAWLEGVPIRIAHNHSVPGGNEIIKNRLKKTLKHFSKLFSTDYFACSEKAARWLFGDKTFEQGKVIIIRNAIDFERFTIQKNRVNQIKKQLCINNNFVIGHIGRLTYAKNHLFMIDILNELRKLEPDAVLLLVGDGETKDMIIKHAKELNLENRIIFTGSVYDVENYYGLIDVMIVPSIFEGLSLTTIESQISGIPVLVSKAIPKEAIISNGCEYIDNMTAEEWAQRIITMSGKKVILNNEASNYDISIQAPLLVNWYESAIKRLH